MIQVNSALLGIEHAVELGKGCVAGVTLNRDDKSACQRLESSSPMTCSVVAFPHLCLFIPPTMHAEPQEEGELPKCVQ